MKEIIYSVATKDANVLTSKLVYGKVIVNDDMVTITNRCGKELMMEANTIKALIAALQEVAKNV